MAVRRNLMAGERAASLTRQLLAFSRRQVLEPKVLDLNGVIANIEKMLRRLIGEDVEIGYDAEARLGARQGRSGTDGTGHHESGGQCPRRHAGRGEILDRDSPTLKLMRMRRAANRTSWLASTSMVAVSDTGCGMDQETQTHIFEPFFTTKPQGQGTGLGLATVYGIIKQSGGFIWVESEPGQGSTFKIYFPCLEEAVHAATGQSRSRSASKR